MKRNARIGKHLAGGSGDDLPCEADSSLSPALLPDSQSSD